MVASDLREIMQRASMKLYTHPNPAAAEEKCSVCNQQATHKVAEVTDDARHPLTNYLCCADFGMVMGPVAQRVCQLSNA